MTGLVEAVTMTIGLRAEVVKELVQVERKRDGLLAELARIDADLTEARTALGLGPMIDAPRVADTAVVATDRVDVVCECDDPKDRRTTIEPAAVPDRVDRICETCGETFKGHPLAAGRRCAACRAGGLSIDDRRAAILIAMQAGPDSVAMIHGRLPFQDVVSRQTIANDIQALRNRGLVMNTPIGWALVEPPTTVPEPDAVLRAHDLPEQDRLARRRCSLCPVTFQPTAVTDYLCSSCVAKTARARKTPKAEDAPPETVWAPGRAAPSLSSEHLGSSLGGEQADRSRR